MKRIYLLIYGLLVISESIAQVPIPLQYQGLQLQSPLQMMQQAEQIRAMQIQNEQAAIKLRQMEEQRKARQLQNQEVQTAPQKNPAMDEWLKSAGPRMHIYPDFEQVVFAPDVSITDDMIRLMASSPLAADIAYYLGTHKIESLAVSKMSLQDAARSIDRIEKQLNQKLKVNKQ